MKTLCRSDGIVRLTDPVGIIASVVVGELQSGSRPCPWVIQAQPGQKINITLLDFGSTEEDMGVGFRPSCFKYGIIRERDFSSPTIICSDRVRERNLYLSQTNRVEIQFEQGQHAEKTPHFLIKYNSRYPSLIMVFVMYGIYTCPHQAHSNGKNIKDKGYTDCMWNDGLGSNYHAKDLPIL